MYTKTKKLTTIIAIIIVFFSNIYIPVSSIEVQYLSEGFNEFSDLKNNINTSQNNIEEISTLAENDATMGISSISVQASNDYFSIFPINGFLGGATDSILNNDGVDNIPNSANISNVVIHRITSPISGITLHSNGTISVAPGTTPGSYLFDYEICDISDSNICDIAYATIYIDLDSDRDGISDMIDLDDDNDGILDTNECNIDILSSYHPANFTDPDLFLRIRPSDFGFTTPGARNLNGSHDYSAFYGLPAGSIIIQIENANVHPTADEFYVQNVPGTSNITRIKTLGTVGVYTATEHGIEYYREHERSITFLDGITTSNGLINFGSQGTIGQWESGNSGQYYYLRHLTSSTENAQFFYANINSQQMFKFVEFGTNNTEITEYTTYFFRILPECDHDKDGIPNRLDTDSDNDTCADTIEGDGNISNSQLNSNKNISGDINNTTGMPSIMGVVGQNPGSSYDDSINSCPINQIPVAIDDIYTTTGTNSINLLPLSGDSDPDGDVISIIEINGVTILPGTEQIINVTGGIVIISITGEITFTTNTGFIGTVVFPYIISDGNGGTAIANEIININNQIPVISTVYYPIGGTTYNSPAPIIPTIIPIITKQSAETIQEAITNTITQIQNHETSNLILQHNKIKSLPDTGAK